MIRHQFIPHLFNFAFAMALAHNFLPHTHLKETGKEEKHHHHHGDEAKSHSHQKEEHSHSHPHANNEELPVFTHFANGDITIPAKHSYNEIHRVITEYEVVVLASFTIPAVFLCRSAPIPYARDLPLHFLILIQSLRAPPSYLS